MTEVKLIAVPSDVLGSLIDVLEESIMDARQRIDDMPGLHYAPTRQEQLCRERDLEIYRQHERNLEAALDAVSDALYGGEGA